MSDDDTKLRDEFAKHALENIFGGERLRNAANQSAAIRGAANASYELADAMMAARSKGTPS